MSSIENMLFTKMREEGKSDNTIQKYLRDIRRFLSHYSLEAEQITKDILNDYKEYLQDTYQPSSANSVIASLNYLFRILGKTELHIRSFRIQSIPFRPEQLFLSKEEYFLLVQEANRQGKHRLALIMETLASTGIRVSELRYITLSAAQTQTAAVYLKGKTRTVVLPGSLCRKLLSFAEEKQVKAGSIFVTRSGKPLDRSNIAHSMKKLCETCKVDPDKVFPHNLRHLFALTYYNLSKDVFHLADILGHSSIDTTRIYTAVSYREHLRLIEQMGLVK